MKNAENVATAHIASAGVVSAAVNNRRDTPERRRLIDDLDGACAEILKRLRERVNRSAGQHLRMLRKR